MSGQVSDALIKKYGSFYEQFKAMSEVVDDIVVYLMNRYGEKFNAENFGVMLAIFVADWMLQSGVKLSDWIKVLGLCAVLLKMVGEE
jgi:hypothetical protein